MRPTAALTVLAFALTVDTTAIADPPAIAAKPFEPLTGHKGALASSRAELCTRPELACSADPSQLALYRAAGEPLDVAWAILPKGPVLAKLRLPRGASSWTVEYTWDFSDRVESPKDPLDRGPWIYPALYPAGPGAWAVAIVKPFSEGYSGGGAAFGIADFFVLGPSSTLVSVLYENVPFSCSKMVRACFSEEESLTSLNCHDIYEGWLTLSYVPSKSAGRYAWTAVWHERNQPPNVPELLTKLTETAVTFPHARGDVSRAFEKVSFCDGGPMGKDP
jgi:hypothetical protein